jgi:hypothetical protein
VFVAISSPPGVFAIVPQPLDIQVEQLVRNREVDFAEYLLDNMVPVDKKVRCGVLSFLCAFRFALCEA